MLESAVNALVSAFIGTALAAATLVLAFVRHDFSLSYVANHSSRELPLGYTLAALWSGQEGSLLLWLLVLTGVGAAALLLNRRLVVDVLPWTVPILAGIAAFFALIPNVVASPFGTQPAPLNGVGMNASLQNPYMMIHPPVLYLGYVSLAIPFAFAMAALLSRRVDERWIVASRRWTLFSWTFLGIAILIGAKWAYESIGWGGYYAWDPVENAALMPWLAATAFLHSVMVQEKKNMLRVWNVVLIALTFSLTLFGTFLTRSGAINSIHSFSQSSIGGWFLALIVVVASGSALLILTRLDDLRTPTRFESLASREAAFLYNNLLLVAFALTMLWGVAFPLLSEALRGEAVTVGPPYYNFFLKVFGLPLLLLMGIGPLLAWRRASLRSVARAAAWPFLLAVAVGAMLLVAGAGSSPPGVIAYTFATFVTGAIVLEFWRGTRARRDLDGSSWAGAFSSLVARNRRRYGGYISHAAVVLLAIGVVGSSAYGSTVTKTLAPGDSTSAAGYSATYLGTTFERGANHDELRGQFLLSYGGESVGVVAAGKNHYNVEQFFSTAVGIHTDWLRAADVMLIGDQFNPDGSVVLKLAVNPLIGLIWLAGIVFLVGSVVAMWPDAREQRQLARRSFEAHVVPVRAR
ncbi:MAG TPA: cytochrome c-type biogenesis CcmF C-terminal domain-containing protein [Gaiella sp.]|uniref:heme lyase CcmF/NrfE family subunit n=1 Tax=Gaiella sp. TaxID=2663207 RepID=UPI002D7EC744|nr:cytochrome c-type biogenesis CcmF C-terminal domain-containing protein [Gaiella sp.]HET9289071.1 cytochrome c-type biogenesis CcmF C-terminal domain-containing protein [Gaiella sp.]